MAEEKDAIAPRKERELELVEPLPWFAEPQRMKYIMAFVVTILLVTLCAVMIFTKNNGTAAFGLIGTIAGYWLDKLNIGR